MQRTLSFVNNLKFTLPSMGYLFQKSVITNYDYVVTYSYNEKKEKKGKIEEKLNNYFSISSPLE